MNVVVSFPKIENANSIRRVLQQSGYEVTAVCTTGAQTLQQVASMDYGIIVCGYRFSDMMYSELLEYMPELFEMVMITSQEALERLELEPGRPMTITMPLKVYELTRTMDEVSGALLRKRKRLRSMPKKRSEAEREQINAAKLRLMEHYGMDEDEAHRYLQKRSMDNGTGIVETAQMVLQLLEKNKRE